MRLTVPAAATDFGATGASALVSSARHTSGLPMLSAVGSVDRGLRSRSRLSQFRTAARQSYIADLPPTFQPLDV